MKETGKIKNIIDVKAHLRGRRYSVTGKTDSGIKIGTIEGIRGKYLLYDNWLEPDNEDVKSKECEQVIVVDGNCVEYIDDLVKRLIEQQIKWMDANGIKRVCDKPTELNFYRTFCKITKTHFFSTDDGFYGSEFHKKNLTVDIYKCGEHPEIILKTYKIADILKRFLVLAEDVEIFWCKEANIWCAESTCDKGEERRCGLRLKREK